MPRYLIRGRAISDEQHFRNVRRAQNAKLRRYLKLGRRGDVRRLAEAIEMLQGELVELLYMKDAKDEKK